MKRNPMSGEVRVKLLMSEPQIFADYWMTQMGPQIESDFRITLIKPVGYLRNQRHLSNLRF